MFFNAKIHARMTFSFVAAPAHDIKAFTLAAPRAHISLRPSAEKLINQKHNATSYIVCTLNRSLARKIGVNPSTIPSFVANARASGMSNTPASADATDGTTSSPRSSPRSLARSSFPHHDTIVRTACATLSAFAPPPPFLGRRPIIILSVRLAVSLMNREFASSGLASVFASTRYASASAAPPIAAIVSSSHVSGS
jgi:hypothetical protein